MDKSTLNEPACMTYENPFSILFLLSQYTENLALLFSGEINHMKPGEMVQFSCDSNLEHYKNFRRQKVSCRKLNHTRTTKTQIS